MKITVLHDQVAADARPDEADALVQAGVVRAALEAGGHLATLMPFSLDLDAMRRSLAAAAPELVFNLVEAPGGTGRLIHLAPSLLESMGLAYTGAPGDAVFMTSNKLLAKRAMAAGGIATPEWVEAGRAAIAGRYIVKSVWEHASVGLDDGSIVEVREGGDLGASIAARAARLGGTAFAERYIAGREFNLSMLASPRGAAVLPPAEITFVGFGDQARIVGYRAKWDQASYEYSNTPRRFDFAESDAPLLRELAAIAMKCWTLFGLRGYARVDFRVDEEGRPWVLEVNTNPCLSPDAGFAAAVERAGIGFGRAVERIVADARDVDRTSVSAGRPMPRETSAGEASPRRAMITAEEPWRTRVVERDVATVREIVESSGFFSSAEVEVAAELVQEHLAKGEASGYLFLFAQEGDRTVGYACYGPIACTVASYDLYWIAVHADHRGRGLGRTLAAEVEALIAARGGTRVYAETSSRSQYGPTRAFYERCGYRRDAEMSDFYAPGDGKVVYVRELQGGAVSGRTP